MTSNGAQDPQTLIEGPLSSILAGVVLENKAARSADASLDLRRVEQRPGHPALRTFSGVPLCTRNMPTGTIGIARGERVLGPQVTERVVQLFLADEPVAPDAVTFDDDERLI